MAKPWLSISLRAFRMRERTAGVIGIGIAGGNVFILKFRCWVRNGSAIRYATSLGTRIGVRNRIQIYPVNHAFPDSPELFDDKNLGLSGCGPSSDRFNH
jgi:hypothetical protein